MEADITTKTLNFLRNTLVGLVQLPKGHPLYGGEGELTLVRKTGKKLWKYGGISTDEVLKKDVMLARKGRPNDRLRSQYLLSKVVVDNKDPLCNWNWYQRLYTGFHSLGDSSEQGPRDFLRNDPIKEYCKRYCAGADFTVEVTSKEYPLDIVGVIRARASRTSLRGTIEELVRTNTAMTLRWLSPDQNTVIYAENMTLLNETMNAYSRSGDIK